MSSADKAQLTGILTFIILIIISKMANIIYKSLTLPDKEKYLEEHPDTVEIIFDDNVIPCIEGYIISNHTSYVVHSVNGSEPFITLRGILVPYGMNIIDLGYLYTRHAPRYLTTTTLMIDVKPNKKYYIKYNSYDNECIIEEIG